MAAKLQPHDFLRRSFEPLESLMNGNTSIPQPAEAVIELKQAGKRYGDNWAVRKIDLTVLKGQHVALIGPSGCGKSTLLRLITGLIQIDEGTVSVVGQAMEQSTRNQLRHKMGYMVQGGGVFPHLTIRQNVILLAEQLGWTDDAMEERFETLAEMVDLNRDFKGRFPTQLSGGQQQRVAMMRALFLDPEIILLDEPMGALDPLIRADLQAQLQDVFSKLGKTMLIVTHDISEAGFLSDQMILLREGNIEQRGPLKELVHHPASEFVSQFINAQRSPLESIGAES